MSGAPIRYPLPPTPPHPIVVGWGGRGRVEWEGAKVRGRVSGTGGDRWREDKCVRRIGWVGGRHHWG